MSGTQSGDRVRWGIAATGSIAKGFVSDLALLPEAHVAAVGSRSRERAQAFATEHGVPRAHGTYEALAEDPDVDIVYVATPQSRHCEDALLFIEAGKHVLCEKPFALNAEQARRMVEAAHRNEVFLMEAIWSRFLPAYVTLRALLDEGRIGEPLILDADFGFRFPFDAAHRLFDRSLGGGALLDLGIYPLQLSSLVFGVPDVIHAVGHLGQTDVDEVVAAALHHPGGGVTTMRASIAANLPSTAVLSGTEGTIRLPTYHHCPDHLMVGTERVDASHEGNGLRFQAEEVHRCLRMGLLESPVMPLAETVSLARTMDEIRVQIGVCYDADAR